MHVYPNYYNFFFYFFSLQSRRISGNSINFDDEKIKKSDFFNKNKKIFSINDIDVNNIYSKNMVNIIHLNTLLGIMIIMLLNHYI